MSLGVGGCPVTGRRGSAEGLRWRCSAATGWPPMWPGEVGAFAGAGVDGHRIAPAKPQQNGIVECFNDKRRDEGLKAKRFAPCPTLASPSRRARPAEDSRRRRCAPPIRDDREGLKQFGELGGTPPTANFHQKRRYPTASRISQNPATASVVAASSLSWRTARRRAIAAMTKRGSRLRSRADSARVDS